MFYKWGLPPPLPPGFSKPGATGYSYLLKLTLPLKIITYSEN